MQHVLYIALGGAVGAVMRHVVSSGVHRVMGQGFPYGTLIVNTTGSLVMGLLYVWLLERSDLSPAWRALLLTGFLGAFTTFSTFSMETLQLAQSGEMVKAAFNIFLNVIICLVAVWVGMIFGRQL